MKFDDWRSGGRLVSLRAREVFVRVEGVGPALVFLHGFPTTSYDFAAVTRQLAGRFRCISFDFAGFGSSAPPSRWGYDAQSDLAVDVAEHVGASRAVLVAHDYGVSVAQELIARQLAAVQAGHERLGLDGVVFLNGGLQPSLHRPLPIQRLLASSLGGVVAPWVVSKGTFARSLARVLERVDRFDVDEHWRAVSICGAHRRAHAQLHYIAERKRHAARWVGAFCDPRVPVALAWGERDPVSGAHVLAWARAQRPDAEVEALGVGHYPQLEAPDETAELIARFAAGLG